MKRDSRIEEKETRKNLTRSSRFVVKPQSEYEQSRRQSILVPEEISFGPHSNLAQPSAPEYEHKKENRFAIKLKHSTIQPLQLSKNEDAQKTENATHVKRESSIPNKRSFDTMEQEPSRTSKAHESGSQTHFALQTANHPLEREETNHEMTPTYDEMNLDEPSYTNLLIQNENESKETRTESINIEHTDTTLSTSGRHMNNEQNETEQTEKENEVRIEHMEEEYENKTEYMETEHVEMTGTELEQRHQAEKTEIVPEQMKVEDKVEVLEAGNEGNVIEDLNEQEMIKSINNSPSLHSTSDVSGIMMELDDINSTDMPIGYQEQNQDTQEITTETNHDAAFEKETSIEIKTQSIDEPRESESPLITSHIDVSEVNSIQDNPTETDIKSRSSIQDAGSKSSERLKEHTPANYDFDDYGDNYGYDGSELINNNVQSVNGEQIPVADVSHHAIDDAVGFDRDVEDIEDTNQTVRSERELELDKIVNELKSNIRSKHQTRAMKLRDIQTEIFNSVIVKIIKGEQKKTRDLFAREIISNFYDKLSDTLNHQQELFKEYQNISMNKQRLNKVASKYKRELLDIQTSRHKVRRRIEEQKEIFEKTDEKANILSNLDDFFNGIKSLSIE